MKIIFLKKILRTNLLLLKNFYLPHLYFWIYLYALLCLLMAICQVS